MSARPELAAEQEIEFGRYAARVAVRWWLPLLGLVAGLVLGYLISVGGSDVFRAQALVYLGDPLAPSGARVETYSTSPGNIREIVTSEAAVRNAARVSGLEPADVRAGIFVSSVSGSSTRTGQPSLVNIGVRGKAPRKVRDAANELARVAVAESDDYVAAKVDALRTQIESSREELQSLERRIDASLDAVASGGLTEAEALVALTNAGVLESRRSTVLQARSDREQLLALAENVERPRIVEQAVPRKVTAQSQRNSIVAAGVLGLLVGLAAALAWDPLAGRLERR
jgi:uncharacterized protein involved in exopolysaccharide biosynthesis